MSNTLLEHIVHDIATLDVASQAQTLNTMSARGWTFAFATTYGRMNEQMKAYTQLYFTRPVGDAPLTGSPAYELKKEHENYMTARAVPVKPKVVRKKVAAKKTK